MKKVFSMVIVLIAIPIILVACGHKKHNETAKTTVSKSSKSSESSEVSKSSEMTSSSETVKTADAQKTDLTKARQLLYQAGIDSSDVSDQQLLAYWKEAEEQKTDFVTYFQSKR